MAKGIKRSDIRGFTAKVPFTKYSLEFVTVKHLLVTIALEYSLTQHTIKRWEFEDFWMNIKAL